MRAYRLHVESGPQKRKTLVHVLELLGCVASGPTTDEAIAATPSAIRAYRTFLRRSGEAVDEREPIEIDVAEHVTKGDFIGNGSPYIVFEGDLDPLTEAEVVTFARRIEWLSDALAAWAADQAPEMLDAAPESGRTPRQILLHALGSTASYLGPSIGNPPGASSLAARADRGDLPIAAAWHDLGLLLADRLRATTPEERALVRDHPKGARSLRKSVRRILEHSWEHLAELSRRPGGPEL